MSLISISEQKKEGCGVAPSQTRLFAVTLHPHAHPTLSHSRNIVSPVKIDFPLLANMLCFLL